jgi:hypothetical protein
MFVIRNIVLSLATNIPVTTNWLLILLVSKDLMSATEKKQNIKDDMELFNKHLQ